MISDVDWAYPPHASATGGLLRRHSLVRRLDWVLLFAVVMLLGLGAALVYAANVRTGTASSVLTKHVVNMVIGTGLGVGATLASHTLIRAYAPIAYLVGLVTLVAVLVPGVGIAHYGSRSWIGIASGFEFQPSEVAKIAVIIMLATVFGDRRDGEGETPALRRIAVGLGYALAPMALIMLQPDFGTTMVFVFILFAVLLVASAPMRWVVSLFLVGISAAALAFQVGLVSQYQVQRLTTFMNPSAGAQDTAYQIHQAEIAVSLGGLSGEGLLHGERTNGGFVPVQESDFVFTVAGEELGLAGSGGIIALLGVVLWRAFRIAHRSQDRFGALTATGIAAWVGIQAFENIGMTIGVMPITGIPLPFISYGGSSMFATLLAVGLLQNIHLHATRPHG